MRNFTRVPDRGPPQIRRCDEGEGMPFSISSTMQPASCPRFFRARRNHSFTKRELMMKKLLLTLSLSLVALPIYADEMSPTKGGYDLPPARTTAPVQPAAPAEAAPAEVMPPQAGPAVEAPPPRAATPEPTVAPAMAARADDIGWYAGVGGGWSKFNGNGVDLVPSIPGETVGVTRLDDSSTAWKVFGGYQFTRNWAVELAYTDLGKFSTDANVVGGVGVVAATEYAEVKPNCWSLSAVGILPLGNNFSLLGKAGVCRWDDRSKAYETVVNTIIPETPSSTGTDLTFGLGAKYDATRNLGVRAEWERFDKVVHDRSSVDLWSLSLQYHF
jgi:OmpA-OmpF porin, OOP family